MRTTLKITLVAVLLAVIPSCGKAPGFTPSRAFVVPFGLARGVNAGADGPTLFYSIGNTQLTPLSFLSTSVFTQVLPEINLELDVLYGVTGLPNIWVQDELIRVPLDDEFTVIFQARWRIPHSFVISMSHLSAVTSCGYASQTQRAALTAVLTSRSVNRTSQFIL